MLLRDRNIKEAPTFIPIVECEDFNLLKEPLNGQALLEELLALLPQESKNNNAFKYMSSLDFHTLYKEGKVTPLQIAQRIIDILKVCSLNAIIKYDIEDILKQAQESTVRYAQGRYVSVLDGVPVAVKDELHLEPYATSVGTSFLTVKAKDAFVVSKFRELGVIFIGKVTISYNNSSPLSLICVVRGHNLQNTTS